MSNINTHNASQIDLYSLFETSKLFNSTRQPQFIGQHLIRTLMGKFLISRGFLYLKSTFRDTHCHLSEKRGVSALNLPELCDQMEDLMAVIPEGFQLLELKTDSKVIGVLGLGPRFNHLPFSDEENRFIDSLIDFSSSALENALHYHELEKTNSDLSRKLHEIRTLYEISKELPSLLNETQAFQIFTLNAMSQGLVSSIGIYKQTDDFFNQEFKKGSVQISKIHLKIPADATVWHLASHPDWMSEFNVESPEQYFFLGMATNPNRIVVFKTRHDVTQFNESEFEFYQSLVHLLQITLTNIVNFREALIKEQLEKEIDLAREIQNALLPKTIDTLSGLDVFGLNVPSKQVGGDYFDVIKISDHQLLLAIADVTGKGIPASLLMANLQSMVKMMANVQMSLSEKTGIINNVIYNNTASDRFITFFWGILNIETRKFEFVNAGHNPPYLKSDSKITELSDGGVILGVIPTTIPYDMGTVDIKPGDEIFMYTDGVSEAMNTENEEFGEDTILKLMNQYDLSSSEVFCNQVLLEVRKHATGVPQSDDITMIGVKWPES